MKRKQVLAAGAFWVVLSGAVSAVDRFVPQGGVLNYPTIQAAMSASGAGDIVRVQPGVYRESITFPRTDITLTSIKPSNPEVVRTTVIQGDATHSVITFKGGQTTNTLLTGFTIRGGGGTPINDVFRFVYGGGIYCLQSSPSIIGNVIEKNLLTTNQITVDETSGGGIASLGSSPRIIRNIIRNNSAFAGGAIFSNNGKPLVEDNWIYDNTAMVGGGVAMHDGGQYLNNTLSGNTSDNLNVEGTELVMNNIIVLSRPGIGVVVGPNARPVSQWFRFNNTWGNDGGDVVQFAQTDPYGVGLPPGVPIPLAGTNGNLSVDPLFVDTANLDFHLSPYSPCINAGDSSGLRSAGESDIDGRSRLVALRVDFGAAEYHGNGNYPPIASAGRSRIVDWIPGQTVALDGSGSVDANGAPLKFAWRQVSGSAGTLDTTNSSPAFTPAGLGDYRFQLVVNNGAYDSTPDTVRILVTNFPPIASAGIGRTVPTVPDSLVLDGSHSLDPEGQPLTYQWRQISGPVGQWINSQSARSTFAPAGAGRYVFELTVTDSFRSSLPDRVAFLLGPVAVANAGQTHYAGRKPVTLDGSRSEAANTAAPLEYSWRQLSGPTLNLDSTNIARPTIRGIQQIALQIQEATFELVVRSGNVTSAPDTVKIVIVPAWNSATLSLSSSFKADLPTVIGFNGGNCDSGDAMSFPSNWRPMANLFTTAYNRDPGSPLTEPLYLGYGDQLITLLSYYAANYYQPIQVMGHSTGNLPACDIAERFNTVYRDPRYLINRITLLDTGCVLTRNYNNNIAHLLANRMPGKMFWIDNYYSVGGVFRTGTLNIEFPVPPADHLTPLDWYFPSWKAGSVFDESLFNNGVFAGAFFSVVGPGKHYQLETALSDYYFGWAPSKNAAFPLRKLVQILPSVCPARLPGLVELTGPADGELAQPGQVTFSCPPVLNAETYQILVGPSAHQTDLVAWQGSAPPTKPVAGLPFPTTYWTIRAADAYGTTSQAASRRVYRDTDGDGLSDESEVLVYHTNPDNADTDGDGRPDAQELLAGTDPLSAVDPFRFGGQRLPNNQMALSWFADPGKAYDLEFSPTLTSALWQKVETISASDAGGFTQHAASRTNGVSGFYRLRAR